MTLLELRLEYELTQLKAAEIVGVPLRTYTRYENDESYGNNIKRNAFITSLEKSLEINEEKGVLTISQIQNKLTKLFDEEYKDQIEFCILFGSYAKGKAKDNSDIDLYISSTLKGLRLTGLAESIRTLLHKKVDLIRDSELENNVELVKEIMKGGIKIYG